MEITPINCSQCQVPLRPGGCYCTACGAALGGTQLQGRTILASSLPSPLPPMPKITLPSVEDLLILLDTSGSMGEAMDGAKSKLEAAVRAASGLILNKASIAPQDRVGLITFTDSAGVRAQLTPLCAAKDNVLKILRFFRSSGGTDINRALCTAREAFDWQATQVTRRILLLTDGHGGEPLGTATKLKSAGVMIDVVGVGPNPEGVNEDLLRAVASTIQNEVHYRFITDQQTLVNHFTSLTRTRIA